MGPGEMSGEGDGDGDGEGDGDGDGDGEGNVEPLLSIWSEWWISCAARKKSSVVCGSSTRLIRQCIG